MKDCASQLVIDRGYQPPNNVIRYHVRRDGYIIPLYGYTGAGNRIVSPKCIEDFLRSNWPSDHYTGHNDE